MRTTGILFLAGVIGGCAVDPVRPRSVPEDAFERARLRMVENQIASRGIRAQAVLKAMRRVPRHRFVPESLAEEAYADTPLPIGHRQTISQPYVVALMTESLALEANQKVLEVGTGSGYQAAILAEMGMQVFSIEIIPELAARAKNTLQGLGYESVAVRSGDGYLGWPEEAPFDAVIVTAAPDHLPEPLTQQLAEGGRLIIPVGPDGGVQSLRLYIKRKGKLAQSDLGPVRFVPLTRRGN